MKRELIYVISNMYQKDAMKNFLVNLNFEDREEFFHLLSYVDNNVKLNWLNVYSELY